MAGAVPASKPREAISAAFGSQVSQRLRYCKRYEVYFTFHNTAWQNKGRQNGLISRMLLSELYKIMVNIATF